MTRNHEVVSPPSFKRRPQLAPRRIGFLLLAAIGLGVLAVQPAAAQSAGVAFCNSQLADTIRNILMIIQFGGPLVGGVIALAAIVLIPTVRQVDRKRELKEIRNQGIIWGVIVAPLGTEILQFILSNVVAGGSSCTF